MLSLPDLATFVTVAESGSIRAAAVALARTQPAVTQAIQRLENQVGVPLVDRSAYRARLTKPGLAFVDRARDLLKQAQALRDFGGLLATGVEPRLRLAIDTATPAATWTRLVGEIAAHFPETVFEIEAGEGRTPLRRVSAGDAELAIAFDAVVDPAGPALERTSLGEAAFSMLVRADRQAALDVAGTGLRQIVVADFERSDPDLGRFSAEACWRVSSHALQLDAIREGLGWGYAPDAMVDRASRDAALASVTASELPARSRQRLSLCRSRSRTPGPVAAALWAAAQNLTDRLE